jgi:hypothetical protein
LNGGELEKHWELIGGFARFDKGGGHGEIERCIQ